MMPRLRIVMCVVALLSAAPAWAQGLPKQVGQCVNTQIKSVETRLQGVPGSGSAVAFQNDRSSM